LVNKLFRVIIAKRGEHKIKINDYVYQLSGPPINDEGQSFLIKKDGCNVVVDSGAYGELAFQNMLYWGVHPKDVKILVNTHAHVDRAGGDWIFHSYGISIAAGERDAIAIQRAEEKYMAADIIGIKPKSTPVGWMIKDDTRLCEDVEIILTPGHTKGSLALVVEDVIVAGDIFGPLCKRWESNEEEWLKTLEKIERLDPTILCTNNLCIHSRRKVKESIEYVKMQDPPWLSLDGCK